MNYSFGPWVFEPALCLINSKGIERELDPLSFKLLNYLVKQGSRIVTRQELIECVWQQSFVDDNAINRAVSELRKQLSHPTYKTQLIKTHYRKGYSLTVEVFEVKQRNEQIESSLEKSDLVISEDMVSQSENQKIIDKNISREKAEPIESNFNDDLNQTQSVIKKQKIKPLLSFIKSQWIAAILVVFILVKFISEGADSKKINSVEIKQVQPKSFSITAATWNLGAEGNPLVSTDQKYFAYSNIYQGKWTSFVKRNKDKKEEKLIYKDYGVGVLSWQPMHQKILLQLTHLGRNECQYALADVSSFPNLSEPKIIKPCDMRKNGYAQLGPNSNFLYFSQQDEGYGGNAIYQYDIARNKNNIIVPPSYENYGALNLKVSNDGKYLAYLWSEIESPAKVYLINLQTRENIFLHELNKAELTFALDWSKDNKKIVVADNNDLFHIDIESKQVDIITLPEDITPFYLAVEDTNKILLSTRNTQHYEILNVENLFTLEPLSYSIVFESDKSNFHPTVNRDELKSLYFVSQRSGQSQIWRGNQDQIEQISQFKDSSSTIKNLRLSNDQKYLLFVRNKKLQFINVYTKELHFVSEINDKNITSYSWGKNDKSIFYSQLVGKNSQIFEFDLLTRKQSLISSTNGKNLISDKQGNVFYLSENSLKSVDGTYEKKVKIPDVGLVNLAIGKDYFYSTDGISTIYRMSLKSGEVSEVKLPFKSYSFAAADDERFLITKRAFKNTQIQRVIW